MKNKLLNAGNWMNKRWDVVMWWAAIALNLLALFAVFGSFDEAMLRLYFNSDALFLPAFFKDIFVDGTGLRGWHFNGAPNFFPDIFLYSIINFVIPNFKVANIVFSVVQYMLVLSGMNLIIKAVSQRSDRWAQAFLIALFPIYILTRVVDKDDFFSYQIISMAFHVGSSLTIIYSIVLLLNYIKSKRSIYLNLLIVLGFIAAFNSSIFFATLFPALVLLLLVNLFWIRARVVNIATLWTLGSSLFGFLLFSFTKDAGIYIISSTSHKFLNVDKIIPSFNAFIAEHLKWIKAFDFKMVIVILGIIAFIGLIILFFRNAFSWKKDKKEDRQSLAWLVMAILSLGAFGMNLISPIINGIYFGGAHLRYFTFVYIFTFVAFVFVADYLFRKRSWIIQLIAIGVFGMNLWVTADTIAKYPVFTNISNICNYYPDEVEKLDQFAKEKSLKFGVANYWDAKFTTMFSKQDLRVYTVVNGNLDLWYHVMNENWYHDNSKGKYQNPVFNFVITGGIDEKQMFAKFGNPLDSLMIDGTPAAYVLNEFKYERETKKPYILK